MTPRSAREGTLDLAALQQRLHPAAVAAPRGEPANRWLHGWLHDSRSLLRATHVTCVPPVGLEPTALGLGRVTKSPAVAVTRALELREVLLYLLWRRWFAVVHPPTHPP